MVYLVANWKNYPESLNSVLNLLKCLRYRKKRGLELIICPPFIYLVPLFVRFPKIKYGVQDIFWEKKICTGAITARMVKKLGCQYVIVGHSERRQYYKETDKMINQKIRLALENDLIPIFCIGESLSQRKQGATFRVLKEQIENGLRRISLRSKKILIAYEPIWSIGTGRVASIEELAKIKSYLETILRKKSIKEFFILYGGSVDSDNAKEIITKGKFQGLLIGKNSYNVSELKKIINRL